MADKDFFLSADDAQTMGDIKYMRRSVRVRHTFPKTIKNPDGFATEKEVSSSTGRAVDNFSNNISITPGTASSFQSVQNETKTNSSNPEPIKNTPKARPKGSNMDIFRNMARNIGKK